MAFGESILGLMGTKDPRLELLASTQLGAGGTPGASAAPAGTPPGMPPGAGTATPQQPQQPPVYQSPPELVDLYSNLMKYQRRTGMIDSGIGLIASAFAHPENRANIMAATSGGGGGGSSATANNPMGFISDVMKLQTDQKALAQKAAHRAALPSIAAEYGLDLQTVQYLFDTGKLDTVLSDMMKPDNQIVDLSDGTKAIVNKTTGEIGEAFGPSKPRPIEIKEDDRGNMFAVYTDTGERVGSTNIVEGQGASNDERLWRADEADRKARGLPPRPLSEFLAENARAGSGLSNFGPSGIDYGDPPKDMAWKREKDGSITVDEQGRPVAVPIADGPMDIKMQESEKTADEKESRKNLTAGLVTSSIDDITQILDDSRDNWILPGPTGWGAVAKWLPATDARTVDNYLSTVKANIGFEKLQQMREQSPTGGALGQVSDFENKLLQDTFGALDQFGKQDTFVKNLYRIKALSGAIVNGVIDENGKVSKITKEDSQRIIAEADAEAKEFLEKGMGTEADPDDSDIQSLIKKYTGEK